jgi:hypothetical protein
MRIQRRLRQRPYFRPSQRPSKYICLVTGNVTAPEGVRSLRGYVADKKYIGQDMANGGNGPKKSVEETENGV